MWIVTSYYHTFITDVIVTLAVIDYESQNFTCNVQFLVLGSGTLADSVLCVRFLFSNR